MIEFQKGQNMQMGIFTEITLFHMEKIQFVH